MNELHSHMIGVMKGGKRLEAKGIEKRMLEKNETMNRTRARRETTEMIGSLETAGTGEMPETAGNSGTRGRCGTTAEMPRRAEISEIPGPLVTPTTTGTETVETLIERRMHTRKNPGVMAETT